MKTSDAATIFTALANEKRLGVFRLLVEAGPEGIAASDIARTLKITPTTLSFHLKELSHAGLADARQDGRFIYYAANFRRIDAVMTFLTDNCCAGAACEAAPARPKRKSA